MAACLPGDEGLSSQPVFSATPCILCFSVLFEQHQGGHRPDGPGHPGVLPDQGEAHGVGVSVQVPPRCLPCLGLWPNRFLPG